jgi:integrase
MVHSDAYLFLSRHNVYYFRVIVPDGIRDDLHKREYRRSMQTRNLHDARKMARALRVCFETHLEGIRSYTMNWEDLRKVLDSRLNLLIAQVREKLRTAGPYPVIADGIWKDTILNYQKAIQEISLSRSDSLRSNTASNLPDFARDLTEEILKANDISLDQSSEQYTKFCEATIRMYLQFTEQRSLLNEKSRSFQPAVRPTSLIQPNSSGTDNKGDGQLISEVVEKYVKEMVAGGNWTLKTEQEYRSSYKLLIKIIHDQPITSANYLSAQVFKETLLKLPSNMNKKQLYRGKSIKEVVAMHIPDDDLLSITKVNAYLSQVSSLFIWAMKNGHSQMNPFTGLKVKEKVAGHEKREPFTDSDLIALFTSPEYQTGKHKHPYHYWLPLLGLFTGARIDELCQLHLEDIYQVGGLWVIDINAKGDRKLKSLSSARVLPLHSRLIALGLIEYVFVLRKNGQTRLFPELPKGRDGYSTYASKWFGRYSDRCSVKDKLKSFHSYRHTVINHLKQQGEVKEKIAAISGHKDESITTGWYGKPYEPANLVNVIESLDFSVAVPVFKM